jgi:hypothetical protein
VNPGVLVVGRCRPLTGAKEREASMHPSPSMTATGGQDDAVTPSARVVPSARCNGSPPNRSVEQPAHEWGRFPLDPSARAAHLSLPDGRKPDWPTRQPDSRARAKPDLRSGRGGVPPLSGAGMRSQTAVRRHRTEAATIKEATNERFRRSNAT